MPALFIHSKSDDLVPASDCDKLLMAYGGKASQLKVPGGHNSIRPKCVFDRISAFLNYHCVTDPTESTAVKPRLSLDVV